MEEIADNCDCAVFEATKLLTECNGIKKSLSWVLVRTIATVYNTWTGAIRINPISEQLGGSRAWVSNDEGLYSKGLERQAGIAQRFTLFHA